MLIRLLPPPPHPTILYGLTFPPVLYLYDLGPAAALPAAWSSQLQILTSVLQLEPPSSIHMLDRAVGLVARVHEVTMDVPHKEFMLRFVDGRVINVPMNSDCVQMLLGVVLDVKGCSEPESQRNSMEDSACPGSTAGSAEDLPPGGSPTKSSKPVKHKRQRSLLFSLISSLVPKSFTLSPHPPPSSAPPPTPLPPLPVSGRVTSPISPQQTHFVSEHPDLLRRRARATLIDVWRRHVLSALAPQHLPAAGYIEWSLIALASKARAEIESIAVNSSPGSGVNRMRIGESRHRWTQSEGRNALDFGDRSDDYESEQRRCRAPSPYPGLLNAEDNDRVVYPRREPADEWGVRYAHSRSIDQLDIFAVEYNGHNDSLLGEHFAVGDDWDDTERLTFELSRTGRHSVLGNDGRMFDDKHLQPGDFVLDFDDGNSLADTAFDMSRCPLAPSDVNDDEQSDDSQVSLRTLEDEDLPPASPVQSRSAQGATYQSPSVSRVSSSRPRSRNASAQFSGTPSMVVQASHPPRSSPPSLSVVHRNTQDEEFIASRLAYLDRICTALELVRSRAREEGWRLVRATLIGAKNGWMDAEAEKSLEIKAKRRAWSSGIKISAPYPTFRSALKMLDNRPSVFRSPMRPPGLTSPSAGTLRARGPIVPTGLSLGIPERSSPLAMYAWSADDAQKSGLGKYGILSHRLETIEGKRSSRVSFADNVSKLFPVCEDEGEGLFETVEVNAIGFPQAVPLVAAEGTDHSLTEAPAAKEDDPFHFCPSRPRTRTTSMYVFSPAPSAPSSPVLPMFRPSTPPPSYQAAVGGDIPSSESNDQGRLDPSALLLQPLSSLSISSSPQSSSSRPPLISSPSFVPRPRAVSMPTPRSYSNTNKIRRTSLQYKDKDEHCEDLSQAYASPPPEGPLVVSATPAPHEQYPRYAHVYSPIPPSKPKMNTTTLGRTGKEVVFEQGGSEFTVGIEVALGRAEEGRVVW